MNPYDPDAALEAIRPRLAAARMRRRRVVASSAAVALLAVSGVSAAAVAGGGTDDDRIVATSPTDPSTLGPLSTSTTSSTTSTTEPAVQEQALEGGAAPEASAPETVVPTTAPPAPTTTAPKPPATTQPPKQDPPPTTKPPVSETQTFTYPGTGSVTVSRTGHELSLVGATAEPGWNKDVHSDRGSYVKVRFTKDNVERWLKVKVHDGVMVAEQYEHVNCTAPAGTSTHAAPADAGSLTVTVDANGKLSLTGTTANDGWSVEVIENSHSLVKVGFRSDSSFVWIKAKVHDCALVVETG